MYPTITRLGHGSSKSSELLQLAQTIKMNRPARRPLPHTDKLDQAAKMSGDVPGRTRKRLQALTKAAGGEREGERGEG